jgi:nucleoside-diphosphate-sugar epimerase
VLGLTFKPNTDDMREAPSIASSRRCRTRAPGSAPTIPRAWTAARLRRHNSFVEVRGMLEDQPLLSQSIEAFAPDVIVHLAAQAGVRYSVEHPESYIQSNLVGTSHVLEAARAVKPQHLLLASTSSVYGGNRDMPFRESAAADWPVTLYAATKKANESMSHSYAHLFGIPTTCFRFFTVYGPWGRPDMALSSSSPPSRRASRSRSTARAACTGWPTRPCASPARGVPSACDAVDVDLARADHPVDVDEALVAAARRDLSGVSALPSTKHLA